MFSRKRRGASIDTQGLQEARAALQESQESVKRAEDRWGPVQAVTCGIRGQLERDHLAERIEMAMTLRRPRHL